MDDQDSLFEGVAGPEMMILDSKDLESSGPQRVRLAYYTWPKRSLSVGCLFDPSSFLNIEKIKEEGWSLYRRPTGGGVMFHGSDLCFSLIVGSDHPLFSMGVLESYQCLHHFLREAIVKINGALEGKISFTPEKKQASSMREAYAMQCCMVEPTAYDLMLESKKVVGCAQRRKKALLHQMSLSFFSPEWEDLKKLFRDQDELATIMRQNYGALGVHLQGEPEKIHREIAQSLRESLKSAF